MLLAFCPNDFTLDEMERSVHDSLCAVLSTSGSDRSRTRCVPSRPPSRVAASYLEELPPVPPSTAPGNNSPLAFAPGNKSPFLLFLRPWLLCQGRWQSSLPSFDQGTLHSIAEGTTIAKKKGYKNALTIAKGKGYKMGVLEPSLSKVVDELKMGAVEACISIMRHRYPDVGPCSRGRMMDMVIKMKCNETDCQV
ncbi:hypothetical protein CEK25_004149 [Fusarium fujikuroi]|nr:hypothetical protein CEK25_004149 [Fusarium fujikuroi]